MAVYHYTIYNTSIYVKTSKDWFIFYILEKKWHKRILKNKAEKSKHLLFD